MITINMTKALLIKQEYVRQERAAYLEKLDVEYMKSIEKGDKQKQDEIAARKQALRDATQDPKLAAAQTPEALKAVVPDAIQYEKDNG